MKICGITNVEDAIYSMEQGADFIGVVRSDKSPRKGTADLVNALSSLGMTVAGVYTEFDSVMNLSSMETFVQLHFPHGGAEISYVKEELGRKVISVVFANEEKSPIEAAMEKIRQGADLALLEYGGEGWASRLVKIPEIGRSHFGIAGRVSSGNLGILIRSSPYFIDVSSSLEEAPGKKSHSKIKQFMEVLRTEAATV